MEAALEISQKQREDKISSNAYWAGLVSLLFVLSTTVQYRVVIAGLFVHAYLLVMPFAIFIGKIKLDNIPKHTYKLITYFFVFYCLANIPNQNILSEPIKMGASLATMLFFAQSVKTDKDFEFVSYGFIICAIYVAYKAIGLKSDDSVNLSGVNGLEGLGNKNAQSLYTLPGLLLACISLLRKYEEKKIIQVALYGGAIFVLLIGLVLSANRSGWLGAVIIFGFMVIRMGVSFRTILIGCVFVMMGYFAVINFAADLVEHKINKTTDGYSSDTKRQDLIYHSMMLGFEYPILGLGLDRLKKELDQRIQSDHDHGLIDPHNIYGYLLGGCGFFTFGYFFAFFKKMLYPIKKMSLKSPKGIAYNNSRILLLGIMVLFLIRGLFTREILYSPNFMGCIGLMYSYVLYYLNQFIDEQSEYSTEEV